MMTHFLYRSQQSAPSELLKGSRGFRKRCGLRRSTSQQSLDRPASTHEIAVTVYLAGSDHSSRVNVPRIVRLPHQHGFEHNRQFPPFQHFRANRLSANPRALPSLTCAATFGMALALERDAMLRINCEAVMWQITTRGFTLEDVLIMAAMNLLASAATAPKREKQVSQESIGSHSTNIWHTFRTQTARKSQEKSTFRSAELRATCIRSTTSSIEGLRLRMPCCGARHRGAGYPSESRRTNSVSSGFRR
jgi:hypothetical protein